MSEVKFEYLEQVSVEKDGVINIIHRPYIHIRLKYKNRFEKTPFLCLVDSGADRNLFPAEIGELLGVKITSGRKRIHTGIGGIEIDSYIHEMKMFVGGYSFNTEIDFSFDHKVPLLGRHMFFRHFNMITFREKEREVTLSY